MVKCKECLDWSPENGCTKEPGDLEETVCLLRHLVFNLNYFIQEYFADSDGEDFWKNT